MSPEHKRLTRALLLSLLIHTWLLGLTFGDWGLWLPGFGFPWQDRQIEAPALRVILVPPQVAAASAVTQVAEPLQRARVEQPVASGTAPPPFVPRAPTPRRTAAAIVPAINPRAEANSRTDAAASAGASQTPLRADRPGNATPLPMPAPDVIALSRTDEATWTVPTTPAIPTPGIAAAQSVANTETAMPSPRDAGDAASARIDQEPAERAVDPAKLSPSTQEGQRQAEQLETTPKEAARAESARLEAARQEAARAAADLQAAARQAAARQETERKEAARVEAAQVEAAQVEAARVEAAQVEAAHVEATRVEAARVKAARAEAARVEAAQVEAARVEAAQVEGAEVDAARAEAARAEAARAEAARVEAALAEAARAEAARAEAARVEAARVEAALAEAARAEAARAEAARAEATRVEAARAETGRAEAARTEAAQGEARREERLRAIGRQLDEEAAQREGATTTARPSPSLPLSWSSARRYRLLGRTDPNAEVILYAEAWARKIELNMTFDMVREAAKRPHADPLVMVAIRSDGSVESVTFVQSSGVAALDEAIRRVVQSQTPYEAFPPALAREFDVLEIRRTWHFDMAIRLF